MIRKLSIENITISEIPDRRNVKILFEDNTQVDVLEFIEKTEVGKRPVAEPDEADSWDIGRLDRGGNEKGEVIDDEGEWDK